MEKDFLGLLSVKEENTDLMVDSGRESGMLWSFSDKISDPLQYLSFGASEEDRPRKSNANGVQKIMMIDKAAETHCPVSVYYPQHISTHSNGWSHDTRMFFPSANQPSRSIAFAVSPPVPVLPTVSALPTAGSIIGSTDLVSGSKQHPGGSAQLTIFYAGSVIVFDDVSTEKARAIMALAGNGAPIAAHLKTAPATTDEGSSGYRAQSPALLSLPGSATVSSRAISPSQGEQICNSDLTIVKSVVPLKSPAIAKREPQEMIHSLGSPSTPLFSTAALPQARKASLARFLEKRKERAMSTTPYPAIKKSPESSISKVSDD